ncbi:hypothetical protein [Desulfosporosinus youngiae]|uniref:Uncharacterized protein n=1 Tax=Desulfosporosinus youngiae DSM 17734 TaxID=768710 RepID=H5Y1X1_9FIRM|nr:hypothetical protein [Desulfosporosinus youngiae]EHQ88022.1 hypothetical protein DesyoDRAFT_0850 [Desulfosporosinus youngiae DSM 17734]
MFGFGAGGAGFSAACFPPAAPGGTGIGVGIIAIAILILIALGVIF